MSLDRVGHIGVGVATILLKMLNIRGNSMDIRTLQPYILCDRKKIPGRMNIEFTILERYHRRVMDSHREYGDES